MIITKKHIIAYIDALDFFKEYVIIKDDCKLNTNFNKGEMQL